MRSLNNIVVVGGGTAGWMTALYAQRVLPESNITVIESEEIGILGAGEGTTPHFIPFLDFLDIPVSYLISNAKATIKNGIKFTNWTGDNSYFYHSFIPKSDLGFSAINVNPYTTSTACSFVGNSVWEEPVNNIDFVAKLSEYNKVGFFYNPDSGAVPNPILNFTRLMDFGIHFDASLVAKCFKDIAISRGIKRIEGVVSSWKESSEGDIKSLYVNNNIVLVDFLFDCTGFKRVFIGGHFKSEWSSYSKYLPVNQATPFFIPIDKDVPPYTEAIAMKYGWMWKIPLQHRYGCGYVYDSSLLSEEDAAKEIEEYLGFVPEYPRANKGSFKFNAGYFETPWVNNCVAIGLSAGFIEPLEATSLWVTIRSLQDVFCNVEQMMSLDPRIAKDFNKKWKKTNTEVSDFLYFHYMSGRSDTEFWKRFTYDNSPDTLKTYLEAWSYRLPNYLDHQGTIWNLESWMAVSSGTNQINKTLLKLAAEASPAQKYSVSLYYELKTKQDLVTESCVSHSSFLDWLKQ